MHGVLVIDKPAGPTSHDVVARVRRAIGERAVGHTGTLDPAATGVLPLVIGRATRLARFLSAGDKEYDAVIRLGVSTDTRDAAGTAVGPTYRGAMPDRDVIDSALDAFRGTFLQQPPAFSAKMIDGHRSYKLARATARRALEAPNTQHGAPSTRHLAPGTLHPAPGTLHQAPGTAPDLPAPVQVTAHAIELVRVEGDTVTLSVRCSAGFYVRSLAHDLGERLGTGAHLSALRRVRSGDFVIAQAVPLTLVERDRERAAAAIVPLAGMLPGFASVVLTEEGARRAAHGRSLEAGHLASGWPPGAEWPSTDRPWIRLLTKERDLIGIARLTASRVLHPSVVLV